MKVFFWNEKIFWDYVDDTMTLCDVKTGELIELNAAAAIIWEKCRGCTEDCIISALIQVYPKQDVNAMKADLSFFLNDMLKQCLIEVREID
jgi:hypothetical protein